MTAPTVLFHVSDVHFGFEDRAALDWFAGEVAAQKPAAVICTGDLTMRGTASEFAAARAWLLGLGVPLTVEPGNHDIPYYYNPVRRLLWPFRHYDALEVAVEGPFELPGIEVVPLRTVARAQARLDQSKGQVAQGSLDRALAQLESHHACDLRLVTCHHPLVDADTHSTGSTRGGKRALAALARAGAQAVLSGHVHDAFDLTVEAEGLPIRLIGAGTLSQRLRSSRPSYNRLEWSPATGLEVTLQTLG